MKVRRVKFAYQSVHFSFFVFSDEVYLICPGYEGFLLILSWLDPTFILATMFD